MSSDETYEEDENEESDYSEDEDFEKEEFQENLQGNSRPRSWSGGSFFSFGSRKSKTTTDKVKKEHSWSLFGKKSKKTEAEVEDEEVEKPRPRSWSGSRLFSALKPKSKEPSSTKSSNSKTFFEKEQLPISRSRSFSGGSFKKWIKKKVSSKKKSQEEPLVDEQYDDELPEQNDVLDLNVIEMRLRAFYILYREDKLGDIEMVLDKFHGRENEMLHKLAAKYRLEVPTYSEARTIVNDYTFRFEANDFFGSVRKVALRYHPVPTIGLLYFHKSDGIVITLDPIALQVKDVEFISTSLLETHRYYLKGIDKSTLARYVRSLIDGLKFADNDSQPQESSSNHSEESDSLEREEAPQLRPRPMSQNTICLDKGQESHQSRAITASLPKANEIENAVGEKDRKSSFVSDSIKLLEAQVRESDDDCDFLWESREIGGAEELSDEIENAVEIVEEHQTRHNFKRTFMGPKGSHSLETSDLESTLDLDDETPSRKSLSLNNNSFKTDELEESTLTPNNLSENSFDDEDDVLVNEVPLPIPTVVSKLPISTDFYKASNNDAICCDTVFEEETIDMSNKTPSDLNENSFDEDIVVNKTVPPPIPADVYKAPHTDAKSNNTAAYEREGSDDAIGTPSDLNENSFDEDIVVNKTVPPPISADVYKEPLLTDDTQETSTREEDLLNSAPPIPSREIVSQRESFEIVLLPEIVGTSFKDRSPNESKSEWKRRTILLDKAVHEIIDTERLYFNDLDILNDLVVEPLLKCIASKEISVNGEKQLVSFLRLWSKLTLIHESMNNDLWKSCIDETSYTDPQLYITFSDTIDTQPALICLASIVTLVTSIYIYEDYCLQYEAVVSLLAKEMISNKKLLVFLQSRDGVLRGMGLESFLIKPVQRVCKYPLLIQSLLKNLPRDLNSAIDRIRDCAEGITRLLTGVLDQINSFKNSKSNIDEMSRVHGKLRIGGNEMIVSFQQPHRMMLFSGNSLVNNTRDSFSAFTVLYNDVLIVSKARKSWVNPTQKVYDIHSIIPLKGAILRNAPKEMPEFSSCVDVDILEINSSYSVGSLHWTIGYLQTGHSTFMRDAIMYSNSVVNESRDTSLLEALISSLQQSKKSKPFTLTQKFKFAPSLFSTKFTSKQSTKATLIQKTYRGIMGRNKATTKRFSVFNELRAVLMIQRAYKRCQKKKYWEKQRTLEVTRSRKTPMSPDAFETDDDDYDDFDQFDQEMEEEDDSIEEEDV